VKRKLLKSIAFEDLGVRVGAPGVPHDQLPVLGLQERSSDLPGIGERNLQIIVALRWRPKSTYIFVIRKARGSAGRTRTPMAC